uniref:Uncharacterized protein n=1 Tax=Romanomermis culicivorax TaxID=13658 RepID=A0A915JE83_ROMCU
MSSKLLTERCTIRFSFKRLLKEKCTQVNIKPRCCLSEFWLHNYANRNHSNVDKTIKKGMSTNVNLPKS